MGQYLDGAGPGAQTSQGQTGAEAKTGMIDPTTPELPAYETVEIPITLRAGVEHRWRIPNVLVLSHVYGQKPRFKWLAPLPPDPAPPKPKRKVRDVKREKRA